MSTAWASIFDQVVPLDEAGSAFRDPVHKYSPSTNTVGYGHLLVPGGNLVRLLTSERMFGTPTEAIAAVKAKGITDALAWRVYAMDKLDAANRLLQSVGPTRDASPMQLSALVELCYIRGYLTEKNTPGIKDCFGVAGLIPQKLADLLLTSGEQPIARFRAGLNHPRSPRFARICAQLRGIA